MLNGGYAYTTIISSKYHGQALLSHLASLYPHSNPQAWQEKLNKAKVISRSASTTTFEVSLHSGRPHQIRIHLASIGHPLVGDPLYGPTGQPLENLPGLPGDGGYFLPARYRRFQHPSPKNESILRRHCRRDSLWTCGLWR
jgi:23S rRNA-/tRNA-specific pseudouridylate synthase